MIVLNLLLERNESVRSFFFFFSISSGGLIELVVLWKCVGKKVKSFVSLSGCVSLELFSLRDVILVFGVRK